MDRRYRITTLFVFIFATILFFPMVSFAEEYHDSGLMPTGEENTDAGDFERGISGIHIAKINKSRLYSVEDGFIRVILSDNKTVVEKYDNDLNILSKVKIDMTLDLWGGACYSNGYIYVVEANDCRVSKKRHTRITKYDMSGNKIASADIHDDGDYAFARTLELYEKDGKLFIAADHAGAGHTGLRFLEVDTASMTAREVTGDLDHSFKEYMTGDEDNVYLLELSEGNRSAKISIFNNKEYGIYRRTKRWDIFKYGGQRTTDTAISVHADVNGITCSDNNIITIGESIDQTKYERGYKNPVNLYITITPKNDFSFKATKVKWLTDYTDELNDVYASSITRISDDRFMVAWECHQYDEEPVAQEDDDALSWGDFHYFFIDGDGNKVSEEYTAHIPISDCQPVVKDNKVIYYSSIANMVTFYSIDTQSGELTKKKFRYAGDYATWNIKKNTLVVSGKGNVDFYHETNWVRDDQWLGGYDPNQIFASIEANNCIKKIIIKKGITGISDNTFCDSDNTEEIYIEPGLKTIGDKCFTYYYKLSKVYVPKSVKKIGEEFGWSGLYTTDFKDKIYYCKIMAVKDSYAIKYAKNKKRGYTVIPKSINIKKITRKSNKIKVKWKTAKKISGYEIEYSTDPDFVNDCKKVKVKGKKKNNKTLSKIKSNKTYYVRIRTYKKKSYETIYGEWSNVKEVK